MELKPLNKYEDRELLELIVSNQVRMEQRLFKIYWFLSDKYGEEFQKNNEHKGEAMKEFTDSFKGLNMQIREIISGNED